MYPTMPFTTTIKKVRFTLIKCNSAKTIFIITHIDQLHLDIGFMDLVMEGLLLLLHYKLLRHLCLIECLWFTTLCLQIKASETDEVSYIVKGEGLHGLVLLQGVHFVQVTVSDEHSSVLRPMETIDLTNTKLNFRHFIQTPSDPVCVRRMDDFYVFSPCGHCRRTEPA